MLLELKHTLEKTLEQIEKSNEEAKQLISKLNKLELDKEKQTIEKALNLKSVNTKILEKIDEIKCLTTQLLELLENDEANSYSKIPQKLDYIKNYLEETFTNISTL